MAVVAIVEAATVLTYVVAGQNDIGGGDGQINDCGGDGHDTVTAKMTTAGAMTKMTMVVAGTSNVTSTDNNQLKVAAEKVLRRR
jgi:hypothetical protein